MLLVFVVGVLGLFYVWFCLSVYGWAMDLFGFGCIGWFGGFCIDYLVVFMFVCLLRGFEFGC